MPPVPLLPRFLFLLATAALPFLHGCSAEGPRTDATAPTARAPRPVAAPRPCPPDCAQTPAERIAEAFRKIKQDYGDLAVDTDLVARCRNTMRDLIPDGSAPNTGDPLRGRDALGQMTRALAAALKDANGRVDEEALADACIHGMTKTQERSVFRAPDRLPSQGTRAL